MASVDEEDESTGSLKKWAWLVGGLCAAAAGFLVWGPKRVQPVQDLAHRLEEAWEEHDKDDDLDEALWRGHGPKSRGRGQRPRGKGPGSRAQNAKSTDVEP